MNATADRLDAHQEETFDWIEGQAALGIALGALSGIERDLVLMLDLERAAGRLDLLQHVEAVRLVRLHLEAAECSLTAALDHCA